MNVVALAMRQHQVGAFALANHPAILKIKRLRRIFSHQLPHPEFQSAPNRAHPLFSGLVSAALEHKSRS